MYDIFSGSIYIFHWESKLWYSDVAVQHLTNRSIMEGKLLRSIPAFRKDFGKIYTLVCGLLPLFTNFDILYLLEVDTAWQQRPQVHILLDCTDKMIRPRLCWLCCA